MHSPLVGKQKDKNGTKCLKVFRALLTALEHCRLIHGLLQTLIDHILKRSFGWPYLESVIVLIFFFAQATTALVLENNTSSMQIN